MLMEIRERKEDEEGEEGDEGGGAAGEGLPDQIVPSILHLFHSVLKTSALGMYFVL